MATDRPADRPTTVVYIATSLDGFIAREDGGIDWLSWEDEPKDEDYGWAEFIVDVDAIAMGRATFEKVLAFGVWPYEGTPLVVLSKTLASVPEHLSEKATVSPLAPRALLADMHAKGVRRVYVDGGRVVQSFLREDLIDELVLTRLPILIGRGIPLFGDLDHDVRWEYLGTKEYPGGLVKTHYRRR